MTTLGLLAAGWGSTSSASKSTSSSSSCGSAGATVFGPGPRRAACKQHLNFRLHLIISGLHDNSSIQTHENYRALMGEGLEDALFARQHACIMGPCLDLHCSICRTCKTRDLVKVWGCMQELDLKNRKPWQLLMQVSKDGNQDSYCS